MRRLRDSVRLAGTVALLVAFPVDCWSTASQYRASQFLSNPAQSTPQQTLFTSRKGLVRGLAAGPSAITQPRFLEPVEFPVGTNPDGAAAGDLNHDGSLDLVVANFTDNTVSVLLGRGDGTFAPKVDYQTGKGPSSIAIADVNGDGKPDLVISNFSDGTLSVLKGNGDGTFQMHSDWPANTNPQSVVIADLDNDEKPDVILVNAIGESTNGSISVLLGKGDGSFQTPVQYPTSVGTTSLTVADLNADGIPDVVVANHDTSFVTTGGINVFLGKGDGTFGASTTYDLGRGTNSVAVADLNGDGKPDLAVSTFDVNTIPGPGTVTILLGNGDGTFGQFSAYTTGRSTDSLVAADLNADGVIDLVLSSSGENTVTVLLGKGDGTFRSQVDFGTGDGPSALAVADLNSDGHLDVITPNVRASTVAVIFGNGDGSMQTRIDYNASKDPRVLASADFNGDGRPDLVSVGAYDEGISVLLGNGDGTFQKAVFYGTDSLPWTMAVGDLNGDDIPDVVTASVENGTVSVLLGKGDGTFQPHVEYGLTSISFARTVVLADFTGDGKPDLLVSGDSGVCMLVNKGDGTFFPAIDLGIIAIAPVAGDYNRDGKADIAVIDNSNINILLGNGNGTFQSPISYSDGSSPVLLGVGDFNKDGITDLVVLNDNSGFSVLIGNGDGTFQPHVDYPYGTVPTLSTVHGQTAYPVGGPPSIAVGDFDGDGSADLAIVRSPGVSIYLNKGDATFGSGHNYVTDYGSISVAVSDFNLDGRLDAAVVNNLGFDSNNIVDIFAYFPGTVSILLNGLGGIIGTASSRNPSDAGQPVTLTVSVKPINPDSPLPTGSVTLMDGGNALGALPLSGGSAVFSLPPLGAGSHRISEDYSGDSNFLPSHSSYRQVASASDFSVTSSVAAPVSFGPGQSSSATITITSIGGFSGSVSLTCSISPSPGSAPTCSLSPASVSSSGDASVTSTLTVSTTAPTMARSAPLERNITAAWLLALYLPLFGSFCARTRRACDSSKKYRCATAFWILSLAMLLALQLECGNSSPKGPVGGTPAGNYAVTIQATSGGVQHGASVNFTVK